MALKTNDIAALERLLAPEILNTKANREIHIQRAFGDFKDFKRKLLMRISLDDESDKFTFRLLTLLNDSEKGFYEVGEDTLKRKSLVVFLKAISSNEPKGSRVYIETHKYIDILEGNVQSDNKTGIMDSQNPPAQVINASFFPSANIPSTDTVSLKPFWETPISLSEQPEIFALLPESSDFDEIFDNPVVHVSQKKGYTINRASGIFSFDENIRAIWSSICHAKLLIADLTHRDPAVFYQLGLAHTLGKPVVMLTQKLDDVPFDLRSYRVIEYQYTAVGIQPFTEKLERLLVLPTERTDLHTFAVKPIWGLPTISSEYVTDIFMVMPFRPNLTEIYSNFIVPLISGMDLTVKRGDDFFDAKSSIMQDVWSATWNAKAIIAECTGRNPNVFYEIGMAHAVGKPVIMITQNFEDVPKELQSLRCVLYRDTPKGVQELVKTLKNMIETTLK